MHVNRIHQMLYLYRVKHIYSSKERNMPALELIFTLNTTNIIKDKELRMDSTWRNITNAHTNHSTSAGASSDYDHTGALCYVVAVVFMYAFSVLLIIGSSMVRQSHDNFITVYFKKRRRRRELKREAENRRDFELVYGKSCSCNGISGISAASELSSS